MALRFRKFETLTYQLPTPKKENKTDLVFPSCGNN